MDLGLKEALLIVGITLVIFCAAYMISKVMKDGRL